MDLKLYDTLTREKRLFEPLDPKNVRMYVCGPTVYDFAHIGNARPVIVFDVLYRLLRHLYGADHVKYVRNITDVDDKINARAAERGISIRDLTEETYKNFKEDVAALGCLPPDVEPRATEHIEEMKTLIERLVASGHAYVAEEHVLFSVPSMKDYGQLSKRPLDEMIAGARVDVAPYKRDAMDFVLWKPSKENEPGWPSPSGIKTPGRPGWHIECSAMSWKHLGETFDIHGGGIDLVFPHHENEIAQSRCAFHTGVMANTWMHNGFLQVEGEKMSKSLGNFVTIREVLKDWPGEVARFNMLQTHYRQPIDWTARGLEQSASRLQRWKEFAASRVNDRINKPFFDEVVGLLCDDLNTSAAFLTIERVINDHSSDDRNRYTVFRLIRLLGFKNVHTAVYRVAEHLTAALSGFSRLSSSDWNNLVVSVRQRPEDLKGKPRPGTKLVASVAALGQVIQKLQDIVEPASRVPSVERLKAEYLRRLQSDKDEFEVRVEEFIRARNAARAAKNWAESDRIRDELAAMGVVLKDSKDGTTWEIAR